MYKDGNLGQSHNFLMEFNGFSEKGCKNELIARNIMFVVNPKVNCKSFLCKTTLTTKKGALLARNKEMVSFRK